MGRESLGEFEQLVLLACLHLGEQAYTIPIIDLIEKRAGRQASHAAVYIALRRLEDKGLVVSRLSEATPERGGKAKRCYRVEPEAVRLLQEARDALLGMWRGLEPISE